MKIQCACGTKVAFDVTPEMARTGVKFVCPNCGQDSSDFVNELIRREVSAGPAMTPPPVEIAPPPVTQAAAPPPSPAPLRPAQVPASSTGAEIPPPAPPRPLSIFTSAPATSPVEKPTTTIPTRPGIRSSEGIRADDTSRTAATAPAGKTSYCSRHPRQKTTHACVMCHKLICPKCMELFGYVCSPHCKEKAVLQGIKLPVYAGQRDVVSRGQRRHVKLISTSIFLMVALVLGAWFWYAWFATSPSPIFSVRFDLPAYSGKCKLMPENQLVFLHGMTLARYDIKANKKIWSFEIMTRQEITNVARIALDQDSAEHARIMAQTGEAPWRLPTQSQMILDVARGEAGELGLHIAGKNVWVSSFNKLTKYDFNTGKPLQVIRFGDNDQVRPHGDEVLIVNDDYGTGRETRKHVDLSTGQTQDEELPILERADSEPSAKPRGPRPGEMKDLNPTELAARYSHMSLPEKIALPATLSIERNQQAALNEMRDQDRDNQSRRPVQKPLAIPMDSFRPIITSQGVIHMSERLLEKKITTHQAMKDPPKKSALEGNLTAAKSMEASGDLLNEMRRDAGGAIEEEDESRYQVVIRRGAGTNATPDWRGEVIGPPGLYPLQTVDVVTGGRSITVLDKNNKQLWQSQLAYKIKGGYGFFTDEMDETAGRGPCVEHGNSLYVYDQGVLTAFDLLTGNVRWRVPSVGVYDLHFNDDGRLYVSTTSASPDKIKYSHQIDLSDTTTDMLMKIDPTDGKVLWNVKPGGRVAYVSGKFIYTLSQYQPQDDEEHPFEKVTGFETPPYMRLRRIDATNGKVLWEYFQDRCPLDVQYDKTQIELVFKKEVVVLKYFTL